MFFARVFFVTIFSVATFNKRLEIISKLKTEQKELTEMLTDAFASSDDYRSTKGKKTDALRDFNLVKAQILNEPANAKLADKLKEVKSDLATEKSLLAEELAVYFSKEGKSEIKLPNGSILKFKLTATFTERSE